eukprot:218608-Amphidinium_carterae.1
MQLAQALLLVPVTILRDMPLQSQFQHAEVETRFMVYAASWRKLLARVLELPRVISGIHSSTSSANGSPAAGAYPADQSEGDKPQGCPCFASCLPYVMPCHGSQSIAGPHGHVECYRTLTSIQGCLSITLLLPLSPTMCWPSPVTGFRELSAGCTSVGSNPVENAAFIDLDEQLRSSGTATFAQGFSAP